MSARLFKLVARAESLCSGGFWRVAIVGRSCSTSLSCFSQRFSSATVLRLARNRQEASISQAAFTARIGITSSENWRLENCDRTSQPLPGVSFYFF